MLVWSPGMEDRALVAGSSGSLCDLSLANTAGGTRVDFNIMRGSFFPHSNCENALVFCMYLSLTWCHVMLCLSSKHENCFFFF